MERLAVAVGSIAGGGWVGFVRGEDGCRLACGGADGDLRVSTAEGLLRADELLLIAIGYFEEALDPPPADVEATQADLAALLRWLASTEAEASRRRLLDDALDAVDDGLPADAVVVRLARIRGTDRAPGSPEGDEQDDLADLLVERCGARREPLTATAAD